MKLIVFYQLNFNLKSYIKKTFNQGDKAVFLLFVLHVAPVALYYMYTLFS